MEVVGLGAKLGLTYAEGLLRLKGLLDWGVLEGGLSKKFLASL